MAKTLLQKYGTNEEINLGFQDTITAVPFGGTLPVISKKFNRVTISTGSFPSVKLGVAAVPGLEYYIFNDTANIVYVRSHSNSQILNIVAGAVGHLKAVANNKWSYVQLAEVNE